MTNLARRPPLGQKVQMLEDDVIRDSARGEDCTFNGPNCNHDKATTVLCHLRYFGWAGISQKPHDFLAAYGCSNCHYDLDKRTGAIGYEDILRALGKTLMRLYEKGLLLVGKDAKKSRGAAYVNQARLIAERNEE